MQGSALLVDGEEGLLTFYRDMIKGAGYDVMACCSGEKALEQLLYNDFDAIITAYRIGSGMNALGFIEECRWSGVDIPILLHSRMDFNGHFEKHPMENVRYQMKELDTSYLIHYCNDVIGD